MPKVVVTPRGPRFTVAPGPPIDVLIPLLLMLSRTPGKSWNDWRNLSPN